MSLTLLVWWGEHSLISSIQHTLIEKDCLTLQALHRLQRTLRSAESKILLSLNLLSSGRERISKSGNQYETQAEMSRRRKTKQRGVRAAWAPQGARTRLSKVMSSQLRPAQKEPVLGSWCGGQGCGAFQRAVDLEHNLRSIQPATQSGGSHLF